ncbi:MAG TPA: hypothetical protein VLH75_15110 [Longimicrobiales bacterium]|nr:hypothetical protein [Longimicrobiales bacterium]
MNKQLKAAGLTILAAAVAGGIIALIVRNQIARHRRDLFSPRSLRRLAALGHMRREAASVDGIRVLRDFIAWEPRPLLRERARAILGRMEVEIDGLRPGPAREQA